MGDQLSDGSKGPKDVPTQTRGQWSVVSSFAKPAANGWVEKTDTDDFGSLLISDISYTLNELTRESMLPIETVTLNLVL